ncbi:hypothetical protein ONE63_003081 [Megalurothrips usitatus]|uniref:Uncharacterized protein n=1 Tax=Megalurothrips usitatus TaxID=439358 RepID=A0AAV7XAL5_9NEOP|nr:hypothetical protein ONE63_003081 [Megalurothrips usitatus]
MSQAAPRPEPQPWSLKKFVNNAVDKVKNVVNDKGSCFVKNGVHTAAMKTGAACSPTGIAGPEAFAACYGIANVGTAQKIFKCIKGR